MPETILYEFPCNEKIRTYLRLEVLFQRFAWFCRQDDAVAHLSAISALFDLADATARSDLRNDLIQELERKRQSCPADDKERHAKLTELIRDIARIVGKSGQNIRENEWLQLIRTRQSLAGGTCEFDIPVLHHWLSRPAAERRDELRSWSEGFDPIGNAIALVLSEVRAGVATEALCATAGSLQYPVNGREITLARIRVPADAPVIPEVSSNKFMLWIRFSRPDENHKLHPSKEAVDFELGICQR